MQSRKLLPWFLVIVAANSFLWLDSLDQYFASRFHFYLSQYIPEQALTPSIRMKQILGVTERKEPEFDRMNVTTIEQKIAFKDAGSSSLIAPAVVKSEEVINNTNSLDETQLAYLKNNIEYVTLGTPEQNKTPALPFKSSNVKVMFAGDSMMQGVAPIAINALKKTYPKANLVDLSKQSTGLTVKRYFDWPTKIKEGIAKENYKLVIIFLGPNDPWDIYENKKVYKFPSTEWEELYRQRVEDVLKFAKENQAHVIWVGLPNMGEERLRTGAMIQNRVFKKETHKYSYQYVPTDVLLGPLDQPYKAYIKDPAKGDILMRASDGIHFTPTALRLISQQVVQAVQQLDQE
ncbi:hypothetical protein PSHI8_23500 [Polynucleobacter sp. SHI8]|uniref:SGNH/GDSL hydrolase family protein n=1 Tax=unclassified Polynucleobacter TaxID=2640945 RepID=UPI00249341A2|nr:MULTISPECIES: DUF459 domain-containing protein [unclassified Polynucleobacter]BDW12266.1 hypothetical protein PSHI2_23480 [Polynucleobacter sp. SHI2]BDW14714.1 hypothetical protein PSHI8_23500 [Polynucleobacter sp. SHI8]